MGVPLRRAMATLSRMAAKVSAADVPGGSRRCASRNAASTSEGSSVEALRMNVYSCSTSLSLMGHPDEVDVDDRAGRF